MKVPVFYDPSDPQNSVLAAGLLGSDLFHLAFMTPFNAVMLGLWWLACYRLRQTWLKPVAGGVRIFTKAGKIRVRLTVFSPFGVMLATTALLAFTSVFVVGFFAGGFNPRVYTMALTWGVILSGGIAAGAWHAFKIMSGKYDLVVDRLGGSLELPITCGRKGRLRVPLESVDNVHVETITKPSNSDEQESPKFAPTLALRGPNPQSERLVEWYDAEKAESFVVWLRDRLL